MSILLPWAGIDPQGGQQALYGMPGVPLACSNGLVSSQGSSVSIRLSRLPLWRSHELSAQVA